MFMNVIRIYCDAPRRRWGRMGRTLSLSLVVSVGAAPLRAQLAPTQWCQGETRLTTRAERTKFSETSRSEDVLAFLDTLKYVAPTYTFGVAGTTTEGRRIPYVVAARPRIETPAQARESQRPVVYINANIHGGEVEGKEAMLALLRDLACESQANVLDSIVLIVVPNYNADGNDRIALQSVNRTEQRGPEQIGIRSNGMGLDLNRDYIKADAPETRAALTLLSAWDPDVYADLHATNGSYHGYALTYSPSLAPGAPLGEYTRDLLQVIRARMRERHQFETFDYGNFDTEDGEQDITDSVKGGWYTYDPRPRFGTNYYGLRGRISVLSEAFSHDPFERRVASTRAFVQELLSLVAERTREIRERIRVVDRTPTETISLRAELTKHASSAPVLVEVLERTGDSSSTEPGVPKGVRRTGRIISATMPIFDRFETVRSVKRPVGYLIPATDTAVLARLVAHGIIVSKVKDGTRFDSTQSYTIDSVFHATRPFQGHRQARVAGTWSANAPYVVKTQMMYVSATQRLGDIVVYMLEPESEDGLLTWNFFDTSLIVKKAYPVIRING